jgi:hypothetical protein
VQNDQIREKLVQQNCLQSLVEYEKKSPNNELPLEIIYALVFTAMGKEELKKEQYKDFIDHVKQLHHSGKEAVRQAAQGIMWKAEIEDEFKNDSERPPLAAPQVTWGFGAMPTPTDGTYQIHSYAAMPVPRKYDIMISYCWANKPLCRLIYERFQQDRYFVWFDENEMHGSICERMAEGIEKSDFILICMSSGYKKSLNCQAEAEYAFKREKKIVPLMVEPKYKADGWLGLIVGSKLYVKFAEKQDDEFEQAYQSLLGQLQRNGLPVLEPLVDIANSSIELDLTQDQSWSVSRVNTKVKSSPVDIENTAMTSAPTQGYRDIERVISWSEHNVVEFLVDNNLKSLLPALRGIQGDGLLELYRLYERSPDCLYKMFNSNEQKVSMGIFFEFIAAFRKFYVISEQCVYF